MVDGELAGLPSGGPATLEAVKIMLSIGTGDTTDDERIGMVVAAVNSRVRGWPVAGTAVARTEWPADVALGANMLATRLYRRKDNIDGVMVFGDSGALYVRRNDPDIAMLLRLGNAARPQVG